MTLKFSQYWFTLLAGAICGIITYFLLACVLLHNPNAAKQPIAFTVFIVGLGIAAAIYGKDSRRIAVFFLGVSVGGFVCMFVEGYLLAVIAAAFVMMYPIGVRILKFFDNSSK